MMTATEAVAVGEPFSDTNTKGDARTWQRVRLSYPDGAVLHVDVDTEWPDADETPATHALARSSFFREIRWAA